MRAVALAVTLSLVSAQIGCFPDNPKQRTIAKLTEGGVLAAGIIMEALTNSTADCTVSTPGEPDSGCKSSASFYGDVGVVLILAGLVGFISTISTTPDDDNKPKQTIHALTPPAKPAFQPAAAPPQPPAPTPVTAPAPAAPAAAATGSAS